MSYSNSTTFCFDCNLTFRSSRALKTHQQRFHLIYSENLSKYNSLSSNLVLAFSSEQFVYITTQACERNRLPLGEFSSKLYPCRICSISFPSLSALNYHQIHQHEQYEYEICQTLLHDMITQIDNDEINSMKSILAQQASSLGLIHKTLANKFQSIRKENHQRIFPSCQHQNRTCANLCLDFLTPYYQIIETYPYKISFSSKGNPFAQGSIISNPSNQISNSSKDNSNIQQKRIRSSPKIKRKPNEQQTNSNKSNSSYTRSLSSMSSTSSTSTRSSSKISRQSSTISFKRSLSPSLSLAVGRSSEKRRRQREQRQVKISDEIEQENDDDDIQLIKMKKPKQRQASNSSIEYVQIINNEQSSVSSLNNIENFKLKSPAKSDDDVIICHTSSPKNKSTKETNSTTDYDEQIRVRCKICGDIIEGRSQFSQHVLNQHSHLLKSNLTELKQQTTSTVVCSI